MTDNTENYIREAERTIGQRLQAIGYNGVTEIRQSISVSGRTIGQATITKGKNKGKTRKVLGKYGSSPSKPGEPPHKQRGMLRQSIAQNYDPETLTVRIGSAIKYAKFLELGTAKMAARPFLRRWLNERGTRLAQQMADDITKGLK